MPPNGNINIQHMAETLTMTNACVADVEVQPLQGSCQKAHWMWIRASQVINPSGLDRCLISCMLIKMLQLCSA